MSILMRVIRISSFSAFGERIDADGAPPMTWRFRVLSMPPAVLGERFNLPNIGCSEMTKTATAGSRWGLRTSNWATWKMAWQPSNMPV